MCNAWGHPSDCNCGWGGVYYGSAPGSASDGASHSASRDCNHMGGQ